MENFENYDSNYFDVKNMTQDNIIIDTKDLGVTGMHKFYNNTGDGKKVG